MRLRIGGKAVLSAVHGAKNIAHAVLRGGKLERFPARKHARKRAGFVVYLIAAAERHKPRRARFPVKARAENGQRERPRTAVRDFNKRRLARARRDGLFRLIDGVRPGGRLLREGVFARRNAFKQRHAAFIGCRLIRALRVFQRKPHARKRHGSARRIAPERDAHASLAELAAGKRHLARRVHGDGLRQRHGIAVRRGKLAQIQFRRARQRRGHRLRLRRDRQRTGRVFRVGPRDECTVRAPRVHAERRTGQL